MDSTIAHRLELAHDYSPFLKIYKNGHVERLKGTDIAPPSLDPKTHVQSKDVICSPSHNLFSRLYLPTNANPNNKLSLLVYYHGGGFCIGSAFSPTYHNYLNKLAEEANVLVVSVDYRRAPEHRLPTAYDDSWTALKWVASHFNGNGPEEWLNLHADLGKVFLAGDSAGANIAHRMGMRFGQHKLASINIVGIVLVHPYFWGTDPIGDEAKDLEFRSKIESFWLLAYPTASGLDDPVINPGFDPNLAKLGCSRVLVVAAEKDWLRSRGWNYYEKLKNSGWKGSVEIMEAKGEEHIFHLYNTTCDNAVAMRNKIVSFLNQPI